MEHAFKRKRRLNILGRSARTKRIFERLRQGWSYDEIGAEEHISDERVRQIVNEVLGKREIDRGGEHAHLQLERLMPALRLAGEAVKRGDLRAIAPLIKVIDRLDKHQVTVVAKYYYGPEERQRLLDKINRIAARLEDEDETNPTPDDSGGSSSTPPIPQALAVETAQRPEDFFHR